MFVPRLKTRNRGFHGFYFLSAIVILSLTAAAKLWGASLHTPILAHRDSLLYLDTRHVLWFSAGYEIIVCIILACSSNVSTKAWVLAITGAQFLAYRLFKASLGDSLPCPCLGTVPKSLGLGEHFTDLVLIGIASYFVCGSVMQLIVSSRSPECFGKEGAPTLANG